MHLRGLYALTNVSIGCVKRATVQYGMQNCLKGVAVTTCMACMLCRLWTAGARVRKLLLCLPEKRRFVLIVVHGAKASKVSVNKQQTPLAGES